MIVVEINLFLVLLNCFYLLYTAKEKFNTDNVSYFLEKVRFPPEKWNRLATNLRLAGIVNTFAAEFGDDTKRLGKLVTHWCANDSSASWQKLVEAVSDCDELLKAKKLAEKVGADPPEEGMHLFHVVSISIIMHTQAFMAQQAVNRLE